MSQDKYALHKLTRYAPGMAGPGVPTLTPRVNGEYVLLEDVIVMLGKMTDPAQLAEEARLFEAARLAQEQLSAIICETPEQWRDASALDIGKIVEEVQNSFTVPPR